VNGKGQQELGRVAGYGSDESPKSAAVAISRIESGKTDPAGRYRARLLEALGHTEEELAEATERALTAASRPGAFTRAMAGPIHLENEARRAQIIASSNLLSERVTFQIRNSERTLERARDAFILPFLEIAARVDWPPLLGEQDVATADSPGSLEGQIRGLRGQTEISVIKAVAAGAADAGGGSSLGAATAAGVFLAVSAAGTASTGTAIASLSGAAASSSTLAWLGGGSLAAGSMRGGTAVLTSIVALPALLAIGGVLVWKGRRLRKEAEAEAEKLDAAQQALEDMQDALPRAERWNEAQQTVIQRAELLGRTILSRYAHSLPFAPASGSIESGRIPWGAVAPDAQLALEVGLALISIILDTQALPVWLGVTTVSQPELTASQEKTATVSEEWIEESLTFAQFDLDEHEEWVRGLLAGTT
jgi:hypothetical protein